MSIDVHDPDAAGSGAGLFGLEVALDEALVHVLPVPWEATVSYGRGTRQGPAAVLRASQQVDLDDVDFGEVWRAGIAMRPGHPDIRDWSDEVEPDALAVIESGGDDHERAAIVDGFSGAVHDWVASECRQVLSQGRIPAVLGGDHSVAYGNILAVAEAFPGVGVLHIDAHADLRNAYLGFKWSHASVFHNALEHTSMGRLVGVAWRDMGSRERQRIREEPDRITMFPDHELAQAWAAGESWLSMCARIVACLPEEVYLSIDIDGLDPSLCPNTGTPVPGGLSYHQLQLLLREVAHHRTVVGFDLVEVSPGPSWDSVTPARQSSRREWDANVGARVLYKLAGCAISSRQRLVPGSERSRRPEGGSA